MTRSAFERVPVSQATEKAYLEVEVTRLDEALSQARERGQSLTLKRMEALKVRRQERLTALLDSAKDPGITFEQLGVDHLVVVSGNVPDDAWCRVHPLPLWPQVTSPRG